MADYIEREALLSHIKDLPTREITDRGVYCKKYPNGMFDCTDVVSSVENIPAADVKPVVHGWWEDNGIPDSMLSGCSVCGFTCGAYSFLYCPMCGAKMEWSEGDEAN